MNASPAGSGTKERVAWWLWPNLLGLDAPIVAVLWAGSIAQVSGLGIDLWRLAALFLAVWTVYLLDRWFDTGQSEIESTLRHRFGERNRRKIGWAALTAGLTGLIIAFRKLDYLTLGAGLLVGLAVGAYFLVFVCLARWPGKEFGCGVGFGCGVMVAAGGEIGSPVCLGLIAVATVNCLVIRFAEAEPPAGSWIKGATLAMAIAVPLGFLWKDIREDSGRDPVPLALALSLAALSLLGLWFANAKGRVGARVVRVLADVALVVPLIVAIFAR